MAKLAKLGGDVPDGEAGVSVEDGIDVPSLPRSDGHQGLVARLPPCADVLPSLLEGASQCVRGLLIEAVEGVAVDVVPHLGLVDVVGSRLLREPEYLIRHLHKTFISTRIMCSKRTRRDPLSQL